MNARNLFSLIEAVRVQAPEFVTVNPIPELTGLGDEVVLRIDDERRSRLSVELQVCNGPSLLR